ncbi:MAG: YiiX/YebB-like N1pC/P60 family cysteine hydrolase, partial [Candidatus Bathyarchaeia archaeon]
SDSFAVLRPRLNKKEKAIALLRAFKYIGQPYDFNYDFNTDNELVCSELISRSFKPMKDHEGINFPMIEIAGKEILPPNRIACLFDNECGTKDQQLNMVLFYDGYDRSKNAIKSDMESFRKSWKRPKWIMLSPIKQWE